MFGDLIKKRPIILFIISLFLVIPVILILFSLFEEAPFKNTPVDNTKLTPAPTSPIPSGPSINIIRAFPIENTTVYYLPNQPVEFIFTSIVSPTEIKYSVSPYAATKIVQGDTPSSIKIFPTKEWQSGTTTITIKRGTNSSSGVLREDFVYTLNTSVPPTYPPNMGDY